MGKFLDHIAAHRLSGCFALTLLGLRREEVGGLRGSDIDLDSSKETPHRLNPENPETPVWREPVRHTP